MRTNHLADEVGLNEAISTTKGCYVGQEIVARLRTYGRVNRRLVGFRFRAGILSSRAPRSRTPRRQRDEFGRVTSAAVSPRFGTDRPRLCVSRRCSGALVSSIDSGDRARACPRCRFATARPHEPWTVHAALVGAQTGFALFPIFGKLALVTIPASFRGFLASRRPRSCSRGAPARLGHAIEPADRKAVLPLRTPRRFAQPGPLHPRPVAARPRSTRRS